jgi:hypothetical protein
MQFLYILLIIANCFPVVYEYFLFVYIYVYILIKIM